MSIATLANPIGARYHAPMERVFIGLGSNLGDRAQNLRSAIEALNAGVRIDKKSSVYESAPMYIEAQPKYLNMVISGTTDLPALELLKHLKHIEAKMGRSADSPNQPRPIDLDILLYGIEMIHTPELTVPHPRMHERAFVLVPFEEITPLYQCPPHGKAVIDMLDELGRYEDDVWLSNETI